MNYLSKEFAYEEMNTEFLEKKLTPIILKFAKDKISNVRLNTALVLKKIIKIIKSKDVVKEIQTALDELKKDQDVDVTNAIIDVN
jgi:hypothetical protein